MTSVEEQHRAAAAAEEGGGAHHNIVVLHGKVTVPKGVAVEELTARGGIMGGGKRKFSRTCPEAVRALLQRRSAVPVYDALVQTIVETKSAGGGGVWSGRWNDEELARIVRQFDHDGFAPRGVRVALCKRTSAGSGTFRWLEFIDLEVVAGSYVPQYDVSNLSGQRIQTICAELAFPNGVAVEELERFGGTKSREKLQDTTPFYVKELMTPKGLLPTYNAFVYEMAENGVKTDSEGWDTQKLHKIAREYRPLFAARGVDVYLSTKTELVSHGYHGGSKTVYRWLEFVDRAAQPNYRPQRGVDDEKKMKDCVIM